jgi:hypothetical protein
MCKIPVIFKIKLAVEKAKNKIGIGKEPRHQTGYRAPVSNLLIVYSPSNNHTCQRMSNAIHIKIITCRPFLRQMGGKGATVCPAYRQAGRRQAGG